MYMREPGTGLSKRLGVLCVFLCTIFISILKGPPPTSTNCIYSSQIIYDGEF